MKKTAKNESITEAENTTPTLADVIRRDLREFVVDAGLMALQEMLERERTLVCGPRYQHQDARTAYRGGHTVGELVMGGRRVKVRRPRARGANGHEVVLPTWTAYAAEDPLHERALAQMLIGVSTRRYNESLEAVPAGVTTRGTSKSAVSRRFVTATETQMRVWLGRDLGDIDLAVLMIDGVYIGEYVLLVAVGIDCQGRKHVLGIREGATENATACKALLGDLHERSLPTDTTILAVLDGSKALAKAVRDVFGSRAILQRCQVHKMRNVLDQLPDDMRPSVREALRQAYRSRNAERAKKLLVNLARRLRSEHPSAAGSVDEGLDETLTVMRFGLPSGLERVLSNTNVIENIIGSVRKTGGRVKRWKNAGMILRWTTAAVTDAAARFRSIAGHKGMPVLVKILRDRDHASTVEPRTSTV
jgi:transposase-like protein